MKNVSQSPASGQLDPRVPELLQDLATRATLALPLADGRIARAVDIVLSGGVFKGEHGYVVQSQTDPSKKYAVNGVCPCGDTAAPHNGMCKHRIAVAMDRRVKEALSAAVPALDVLPALPCVPVRYVIHIKGQPFVKFAGLLQLAHERGLIELNAVWTFNDSGLSLAQAVAVFPFGRFTESGDATPDNVSSKVVKHFRRVALTRAKSRALRDALNIDMVAFEELGEE